MNRVIPMSMFISCTFQAALLSSITNSPLAHGELMKFLNVKAPLQVGESPFRALLHSCWMFWDIWQHWNKTRQHLPIIYNVDGNVSSHTPLCIHISLCVVWRVHLMGSNWQWPLLIPTVPYSHFCPYDNFLKDRWRKKWNQFYSILLLLQIGGLIGRWHTHDILLTRDQKINKVFSITW